MLNELVTNAIKHAFRDRLNGEITTVLLRNPDGAVFLRISDDGVGLPSGSIGGSPNLWAYVSCRCWLSSWMPRCS